MNRQNKLIWICPWSWYASRTHGRFPSVCPVLDGGPKLRHELTWLWEEMQCFHCSGPEAIKLPHAVPFAKAHCCRFTANMISPLTAVISRSPGPVWLWSLTLCQSKLVILQYWLLLFPCRVLSKNKHGLSMLYVFMKTAACWVWVAFTRVPHVTFEPTVPLLLWRATFLLYD